MCGDVSAAVARASRSKRRTSSSGSPGHRAQRLLADELDRRRPDQQPVPRAPDLAHAAPADLLLEQVLSQLARLGDLLAQSVQDP